MSVSPLRFLGTGSGVVDDEVFSAFAAATRSSLERGSIRLPSSFGIFPHSLLEFRGSKFEYRNSVASEGSLGMV